MPVRLVIADDHPIVLDGLEQLFRLEPDFALLARCREGEETLRAVRTLAPDVLVLDLRMPGRDGIEVLRALRQEGIPTRVVLLTAALDDRQLVEAIRLGARGVVLKEMAPALMVEAVRKVNGGGEWLDQGVVGRALRKLMDRERGTHEVSRRLTPRELELVRMVARGMRNREIANQLYITEGTVKIHLHNVYEKLQVKGRVELTLWAQDQGLV